MTEADDTLREALTQKAQELVADLALARQRVAEATDELDRVRGTLRKLEDTAEAIGFDLSVELQAEFALEANLPDGVSMENLVVLIMNGDPDRVWPVSTIIDRAQGFSEEVEEPTVRAAISRARRYQYLQRPRRGHYLLTERGKETAEEVAQRLRDAVETARADTAPSDSEASGAVGAAPSLQQS